MKKLIVLCSIVVMCPTARPAFAQNSPSTSAAVRGYSVVLLLGEAQGSSMPETLSAPARKALADVKDFLPYKSYRLLDTQWLAGGEPAGSAQGTVRGPDDATMPFTLMHRGTTQSFQLFGANGKNVVLETAFTARPGETVVVGTSRVQGDKALIVLLSIVTDLPDSVFELGAPGVVAPVPTVKPKPTYTPEALKARVAGIIKLSGIVRANGSISDVAVVSGLDPDYGLNDQAVKNVQGWTFKPGMKDGKPVDVRVSIDVEFTLGR